MASIRIEMDRGTGWELRGEGMADATVEQAIDQMMRSAIQYPHRVFFDDKLVAEARRPHGARGKATLVRF